MLRGVEFFTATCLSWQPLLALDDRKQILTESLKFMVGDGRIWVYGFVIMPNHFHVMWRRQDAWLERNTEQIFLKFTAQQIKFRINDIVPGELQNYKSTQADRLYQFWERRPFKATMYNRKVATQKLNYIIKWSVTTPTTGKNR